MKTRLTPKFTLHHLSRLLSTISFVLVVAFCRSAAGGTWTPLANLAPDYFGTMLLLSDGTVMAEDGSYSWYRLTPDFHGSYVNGTWSTLASMNYSRLYFSSQVLPDGRVYVAGAEYGTGGAASEIYDPLLGTWTTNNPPVSLLNPGDGNSIADAESKMLPDGTVLDGPVNPLVENGTLIYNPKQNIWSAGEPSINWQAEASWVTLPDGSILTVDPGTTYSERYIPALGQWVADANLPVYVWGNIPGFVPEIGPAFLLPNGTAFFLGGSGQTAIYTPSGNANPGTWAAGPVIPNGLVSADAPAAMMANGKILCAAAPAPYVTNSTVIFPSPTSFYEYDPVANSFTQVNGPTGTTYSSATYIMRMLDLPDGTVLLSTSGNELYDYQPNGSPLASGLPAITGITQNTNGSYHLTGTQLNGISQGAAYGDDAQMDSNYPLVRMTNNLTGLVYYARTYNWSSTGVMTGANIVTTEFTVPATIPAGEYSLVAVANGISSGNLSFSFGTPVTNTPVSISGYNAGLIVPANATGGNTANYVTASFGSWGFYSSGLTAINYTGGDSTNEGLPPTGSFISLLDDTTSFQLGTYGTATNVLLLSPKQGFASSGTLSFVNPQACSSLSILASSGDGYSGSAGQGTFVLNFTNGSVSPPIVYNAQDWYSTTANVALTHFGRIYLGYYGQFYTDNPAGNDPNLYQTQINLATLGLSTQAIASITFTMPADTGNQGEDTGIFAISGTTATAVIEPTPVLQALNQGNGMILLSWNAASNLVYQVQYKTNLAQTTWAILGGNITAANNTASASDSIGTGAQRFYRIVLQP